jgi:hypothetical protein
VIARGRSYHPVAMPLDGSHINAYLELYEAPCELHIFVECVFALDNLFLDGVRKQIKNISFKSHINYKTLTQQKINLLL